MFKSLHNQNLHDDADDTSRESEFLRQLALAYYEIYSTGLAIVGNRHDADDVIQESASSCGRNTTNLKPAPTSGNGHARWPSMSPSHLHANDADIKGLVSVIMP